MTDERDARAPLFVAALEDWVRARWVHPSQVDVVLYEQAVLWLGYEKPKKKGRHDPSDHKCVGGVVGDLMPF